LRRRIAGAARVDRLDFAARFCLVTEVPLWLRWRIPDAPRVALW
jgi:hypothetical protein